MDKINAIISGIAVAAIVSAGTWVVNVGLTPPQYQMTISELADRPIDLAVRTNENYSFKLIKIENTGQNSLEDQKINSIAIGGGVISELSPVKCKIVDLSDDIFSSLSIIENKNGCQLSLKTIKPGEQVIFSMVYLSGYAAEVNNIHRTNTVHRSVDQREHVLIADMLLNHWIFSIPSLLLSLAGLLIFRLGYAFAESNDHKKRAV